MRTCENCGTKMPAYTPRLRGDDGKLLCDGCHPNGAGPGEGRPLRHGSVDTGFTCEACNAPMGDGGLKVEAGKFVCPDGCKTAARPSSVSDHEAVPEWDTAQHSDLCDVCEWPVTKRDGAWTHDEKNPVEWTDRRKQATRWSMDGWGAGGEGPTSDTPCSFHPCDGKVSHIGKDGMVACDSHKADLEEMGGFAAPLTKGAASTCSRCGGRGTVMGAGIRTRCPKCKGKKEAASDLPFGGGFAHWVREMWHAIRAGTGEIPSWFPKNLLLPEEVETGRFVSSLQAVAHDSGDGETLYHCPFCGGGQITARSDRTTFCDYCQMAFTVQVQPERAGFPQTVNGVPQDIPGMPGMPGEPSSVDAEFEQETGAVPAEEGPTEDIERPAQPGSEKKDNVPPQFKKSFLVEGIAMPEDSFIKRLALAHADDRDAVLEEIRSANRG